MTRLDVKLTLPLIVSVSALLVFMLYPGWIFYDSAMQWGFAKRLVDGGFPRRLSAYSINSQWPIFMTLLKVPFLALIGGPGLYIFCQSVLTFVGVLALVRTLASSRLSQRAVLAVFWMIAATPFVWGYAIFHSSDTIAAVTAAVLIGIIMLDRLSGISSAAFFSCAAVLALSRYNALPAVVFLICAFSFTKLTQLARLRTVALASAVVVLALSASTVLYQRTARSVDIVLDGMLLRIWEVNQRVEDTALHYRLQSLAIRPVDAPLEPDCFELGTFCKQMRKTFELNKVPYATVRQLYLDVIRDHPVAFVQATARFAYHQMGFTKPLAEDEVGWQKEWKPPFEQVQQRFDDRKILARDLIHGSELALWGAPARPIVMITLSLLAAYFVLRSWRLTWVCGGFYMFWYGPLLALAPAYGFRYAYPMTLVAYVIIGVSVAVFVSRPLRAPARLSPL